MSRRPRILFAVTDSISCVLYRGMLRYLGDAGSARPWSPLRGNR